MKLENPPVACPLTPRQLEFIELLADGLTYQQIAQQLGLAASTVRTHLHQVYGVLGVADRAQAVITCAREGWIDLLPADADPQDSTARLLRRLDESVRELVVCIESRRQVTPVQRDYLTAFDRLLRARTDDDYALARRSMDLALGPVLTAAGVTPRKRQHRDLVEVLVAYVQRAQAA